MPERDDQLPRSSTARVERSIIPVVDMDPSESPPPTHVKGKGKRHAPPPPPKKEKKPKQKKPPPKLAYDMTNEELREAVREEMDRQIFKSPKPPVEKPIDWVKFHRFMRKIDEERRKKPHDDLPNPLSDYDWQVLKTQRAKKKTTSKVSQLGT
jgi:hypothetical protein